MSQERPVADIYNRVGNFVPPRTGSIDFVRFFTQEADPNTSEGRLLVAREPEIKLPGAELLKRRED